MYIESIDIPVVSAIFPSMEPVTVKVSNVKSFNEAVRMAKNHAAKFERIAGPVVPMTEHEYAVAERRKALAQNPRPMTREQYVPFYRQPEPRGAMYQS